MSILKNLTFTAVPARAHDPVAARRDKLAERLEEQKALLANPSYVRVVQRWTGRGEERRQVEKLLSGTFRTLCGGDRNDADGASPTSGRLGPLAPQRRFRSYRTRSTDAARSGLTMTKTTLIGGQNGSA